MYIWGLLGELIYTKETWSRINSFRKYFPTLKNYKALDNREYKTVISERREINHEPYDCPSLLTGDSL